MREMRDDMQRAIADIQKKVDEKLSKVVQKIEGLEVGQKELSQKIAIVNAQVIQVDTKTHKLDTAARMLEEDLNQVQVDTRELYNIVEVEDNKLCKNNLCLRGLKEGIEGDNLKTYIEALLISCMGSETYKEIK